jgi:hypothetical protein
MLLPRAAASTASTSALPAVMLGVVAIVAIIFLLVRVLAVLSDVAMAIKALLANSETEDRILRRNKDRRKGSRSSFGPRTKPERPE